MSEVPTIQSLSADDSQNIESLTVKSEDTEFISVLSEEKQLLETNFESTLQIVGNLIEFYSIDPTTDEKAKQELIDIFTQLKETLKPEELSLQLSKIFQLDKSFQKLYKLKLKELKEINETSFEKISSNFEDLYEQNLKNNEIRYLESKIGNIKPIELDDEVSLTSELSKDEITKLLDIERRKRLALSYVNEQLLEPQIKTLKNDYEKWNKRDKELKNFFTNDIQNVSKKIDAVKQSESLDI